MSANPQPSLRPVAVTITYVAGVGPTVDQDPIVIDRNQGGNYIEIEWLCQQTFSVSFPNGSPFQQQSFNNRSSYSGAITANASGTYKYNVEVNGQILDPQVIVRP